MRKQLLYLLLAAWATLSLQAQTPQPPKPYYKTGFEDVPTQTLTNDTITINGVRWHIVNGRIIDDNKAGITFGNRALELTAGFVDGVPAMMETVDPIEATQVTFSYIQSGIDGLIFNGASSWFVRELFNRGKTWAETDLKFDATQETTGRYERVEEQAASYHFRIYFKDLDRKNGSGWRIIVDDVAFYNLKKPDGSIAMRQPWTIYPASIFNRFETAQTTLSFHPVSNGDEWIMGPPDQGGASSSSYIEIQLDDNTPTRHWRLQSVDSLITYENLALGDHSIRLRFMDGSTGKPYEGLEDHVTKFTVKPISTLHSLEELLAAPVGGFYEVILDKRTTFVNFPVIITPEKWLWDGEKGIMLFDPRLHDKLFGSLPEHALIAKRIVGQLVERDHNLYFVLDTPGEYEVTDKPFQFINRTTNNISKLLDNQAYNMYAPISIQNVKLMPKQDGTVPYRFGPMEDMTITDSQGNTLKMQNFFPFLFLTNPNVIPSGALTIFGMLAHHRVTGEAVLLPIMAQNYTPDNAEILTAPHDAVRLSVSEQAARFDANEPFELTLRSLDGRCLQASPLALEHTTNLKGTMVAVARFADGRIWVDKVVL